MRESSPRLYVLLKDSSPLTMLAAVLLSVTTLLLIAVDNCGALPSIEAWCPSDFVRHQGNFQRES